MPHFVVEHGNALVPDEARSNAMNIVAECAALSDHINLRMLAGRTMTQKRGLYKTMRDAFDMHHPKIESISIEFSDLDPEAYKKGSALVA